MVGSLKYKTIKCENKEEFDLIINRHLEIGWTLLDNGFSYSEGLYFRELIYNIVLNVCGNLQI